MLLPGLLIAENKVRDADTIEDVSERLLGAYKAVAAAFHDNNDVVLAVTEAIGIQAMV
jgi:hypothetical protein